MAEKILEKKMIFGGVFLDPVGCLESVVCVALYHAKYYGIPLIRCCLVGRK